MTQANKPYTFTNGQTADATQVNSDFDTLYTDINGNLDESNIKDGTLSTAVAQEGVKPSQTEGIPYTADLFGGSFLVSGGVPTKDGTNAKQINVPAYVAYLLQPDSSLRRTATLATSYQVSVANGTYYLDLNPDGTFSWGGSHSTQTNYVSICTVVADGTGNVSTITDTRPTNVNFLNGINETIQSSKLNVGQVGSKSVTDLNQSYPTNLFSAFVYTGLTASKDGTTATKLNVTAGTAYLLQTDSTLHERDLAATSFTTSVVSTTYYLDLNPDATWSWGTTHSTVTNYMPIAQVTTDASGNISTVTDKATRTANLLPSLGSGVVHLAGASFSQIKRDINGAVLWDAGVSNNTAETLNFGNITDNAAHTLTTTKTVAVTPNQTKMFVQNNITVTGTVTSASYTTVSIQYALIDEANAVIGSTTATSIPGTNVAFTPFKDRYEIQSGVTKTFRIQVTVTTTGTTNISGLTITVNNFQVYTNDLEA